MITTDTEGLDARDVRIPVASVERMREAQKAAGKTAEIIVYPGTPHALHSDYRPAYREGPAKDGSACSSGSSARRRLNRLT
jgi:dienelactone hydrolase